MPDLECRVAKLEQKLDIKIVDDKEYREEVSEILHDIQASIKDMQLAKSREKGFIGGVVFIVGALASIATIVVNKFF